MKYTLLGGLILVIVVGAFLGIGWYSDAHPSEETRTARVNLYLDVSEATIRKIDSVHRVNGNDLVYCELLRHQLENAINEAIKLKDKSPELMERIERIGNETAKRMHADDRPTEPSVADIEIIKKNENQDETGTRHAYVTVKNNSTDLASSVVLRIIYYDKNGNVAGTGIGIGSNIGSGKERVIECMAMSIYNAKTYKIEIKDAYFESTNG